MEEIEKKVEENRGIQVELLKDTLNDLRAQNKFIKRLVLVLSAIIFVCVLVIVGQSVYSHERLIRFLEGYDLSIESTITTDNTSQNDGINHKMEEILNVPKGYDLVCFLPIGVVADDIRAPSKKSFGERAWFNSFENAD